MIDPLLRGLKRDEGLLGIFHPLSRSHDRPVTKGIETEEQLLRTPYHTELGSHDRPVTKGIETYKVVSFSIRSRITFA